MRRCAVAACPHAALGTASRPDPPPTQQILAAKPFCDKCVHVPFPDQVHGWMAARGDWTKPKVAAAAGRATDILVAFYKNNVTV